MIVWLSPLAISGDGTTELFGQHYIVALDSPPSWVSQVPTTPARYRGLGVVGTWYEGSLSPPEPLPYLLTKHDVGDGPASKIYWQLPAGITGVITQGVEMSETIEAGAHVSRVATQAVLHDVWTPVNWDTVAWNPFGMYNASDPTKLAVYVAGVYQLNGGVIWPDLTAVGLALRWAKNGVALWAGIHQHNTQITGWPSALALGTQERLQVGDYVCLEAYQGHTGTQNITTAFGRIGRISG